MDQLGRNVQNFGTKPPQFWDETSMVRIYKGLSSIHPNIYATKMIKNITAKLNPRSV